MTDYPPPAGPPSGPEQPRYGNYPGMPPAGQQPCGAYPQGGGYPQGYGAPGGYGHGGYGGYGGYGQNGSPRNGLGTAGLILGILGIIPLAGLVIPNVLAIIFGIVGRARVARGEATNRGNATAALVLGIIGLLISIGLIVVIVLIAQHTTCFHYSDGRTECHTN